MAYTTSQLVEMVAQAAARYGLDPRVAVEQIRQESGFRPDVTSSQGAQGIAQFMPATARAYGLSNPFDPAAALDAYARHMRDLLSRFGGDYRLALAAYHSGPGAARAALANPQDNPRTNNYVNTILSRAGAAPDSAGPDFGDFDFQNAPPWGGLALFAVVGLLAVRVLRG